MTVEENGQHAQEARSSMAIKLTAKGEPTVEVKVYVGEDPDALVLAREQAVENFQKLMQAVGR